MKLIILAFVGLLFGAPACAQTISPSGSFLPISSLPQAAPLTGAELVPLVQGGITRSALASAFSAESIAQILSQPNIWTAPQSSIYSDTAPTSDGAHWTVQNSTTTAYQIYRPLVPPGWNFMANIRSTLVVGPGTTVQGAAAYDAYVLQNVATGTSGNSRNGVGVYINNVIGVDNATTWSFNTSCVDNTTNGLATLNNRACVGYEVDFTDNSTSVIEAIPLIIQGPGTPISASGIHISRVAGSVAQWSNGFICDSGACATAVRIGALATSGANIASQPIVMGYFNGASVIQGISLQAFNAALNVTSTAFADGLYLQSGTGNVVLGASGTSSAVNIKLLPQGAGAVYLGPNYYASLGGNLITTGEMNASGGLPNINGSITHGNCIKWSAGGIQDSNIVGCGSGTVNSGTGGRLAWYASTTNAVSDNANATISGGALTLGVAGSAQGSLVLAGSTSGSTTITAPTSGGGAWAIPAGSDIFAGLAAPQTFTSKVISGSSNTLSNIALASLATQTANTIVGNATSGSASPTALAIGSCSTAASALQWTTNTGFGCNTSITAAAVPASGLTGATLAAAVTASSLTSFGASPSLTTPGLSGETFSTAATVTAGTNAQGQGALTNDLNIITTAANNPSGVTLPTATTGRRIVIVNNGANPIKIYPASGGSVDALSANTAIALAVGSTMELNASSTTQWYSSNNDSIAVASLTGAGTGVLTALAANVSGSGGFALVTNPQFTANVGIGTAAVSTIGLNVSGSITNGAGNAIGALYNNTLLPSSGSSAVGFQINATVNTGGNTLPGAYGGYIAAPTKAGGGTITTTYSLFLENPSSGATNYSLFAAGLVQAANIGSSGYLQSGATTVGSLPTCNAGAKGERHFVTDATVAASGNFGATVAGGSSNNVPVTCTGSAWIIGANDNIRASKLAA